MQQNKLNFSKESLSYKLLIKFTNCRLLKKGDCLVNDTLLIYNGKIVDPEHTFYVEKRKADIEINCEGKIVAPGFIDVQVNGGFGFDFTGDAENITKNLSNFSKRVLDYGVTAFCPTITSTEPQMYAKLIPQIQRSTKTNGASVLGIHLEGPFINKRKSGAHDVTRLQEFDEGIKSLEVVYGAPVNVLAENCAILTLAPELDPTGEITKYLSDQGIIVSMGHTEADYHQAIVCVNNGARFITHFFNAMAEGSKRNPGYLMVINDLDLCKTKELYYGVITDGVHLSSSHINSNYCFELLLSLNNLIFTSNV